MRRTSAGYRSATQPRTKNVAFTPRSSKIASSRSVFATTRLSNESQRWRGSDALERADLEVVLHVDGHRVDDSRLAGSAGPVTGPLVAAGRS